MNKSKLKVGERLTIHCYKHDGTLHRTWDEATVLFEDDEKLICANKETVVTENDGHSHRTNEPAILFFYKKHWFNVIGQLKPYGLFYYCNIASPYVIDCDVLKYIDYDLDLRVFNDGAFKILDRNEYNYHKKLMKYPREVNYIIKEELSSLIEMKKAGEFPFDTHVIEYYYNIFRKITK